MREEKINSTEENGVLCLLTLAPLCRSARRYFHLRERFALGAQRLVGC